MARKKQEIARYDLAAVYVHQERALQRLQILHEQYQGDHPEISVAFETIAESCVGIQQLVRMVWFECWRKVPDDIMAWWDRSDNTATRSK